MSFPFFCTLLELVPGRGSALPRFASASKNPPCWIYSGICQVHLLPKRILIPRPVLGSVWLTCDSVYPKGSRHKAGKVQVIERSLNRSAKVLMMIELL